MPYTAFEEVCFIDGTNPPRRVIVEGDEFGDIRYVDFITGLVIAAGQIVACPKPDVPIIQVNDTASLDMSGSGCEADPLSAVVKVSATGGNQISQLGDGLYVGAPAPLTVNTDDTASIDMSGNGSVLDPVKGAVKRSAVAGNKLTENGDGLYVATNLPHSFAGKGTTDASGNVTIPFGTVFPVVPDVAVGVVSAIADLTEARITALTTSSVTINVQRAPAVTVLSVSVLGARIAASGVEVHVVAQAPGRVVP